ncbi:Hsp20/alpha crystallin family protein [Endothiovibrio diazotrophicus]
MTLVRYDPFRLFNQLQSEMNTLFDNHLGRYEGDDSRLAVSDWAPAVDIREEEGRYLITADLPGVEAKDVEVTLENSLLSIQGKRELERREEHEGYRRVERASGSFHRRFSLPEAADPEKVEAHYANGVLEVTVGKRETAQPRRIEVKTTH